jgi:hypothetical protein
LAVLDVGVVQRLGDGRQRGRCQHGEHLVEDPLLESAAAEALAVPFVAIQLRRSSARVAGTVSFRTRVGGLHHPTAPAAADQALQQGGAFPHRAAAGATGWTPVGPQLILDLLEPFPRDEARMVIGDQHRPLVAGQHPGV